MKHVRRMTLDLKYFFKITIGILLGIIIWVVWNLLGMYFPTLPYLPFIVSCALLTIFSLLFIPLDSKIEVDMETSWENDRLEVEVRSVPPPAKSIVVHAEIVYPDGQRTEVPVRIQE